MHKFILALSIMTTITVVALQAPLALAQGQGPPGGPPVHIGNPHDVRGGPPIASCSADFHQGASCKNTPNSLP